MPFHLSDGVFAARDLEVRDHCAFIGHEDDARSASGHCKHHIDFAVRPGRQLALLAAVHLNEVVKEHRHGSILGFLTINLGVCLFVSLKLLKLQYLSTTSNHN